MFSFVRFSTVALAAFAALVASAAQSGSVQVQTGSALEGRIRLEALYDSLPEDGFVPVRVSVDNPFSEPLSFRLSHKPSYSHGGGVNVQGDYRIEVAADARSSTIVYVPCLASGGWGGVNYELSGPQIRSATLQLHKNYSGGSGVGDVGHIGMGDAFAAAHSGQIENELKTTGGMSHGNIPVTKIGVAFAPADRRAYDGFATLWFTEAEWGAHEPAMRAAVLEWVSLGGELFLLQTSPQAKESVEKTGFGTVHRVIAPNAKTFAVRVATELKKYVSPATLLGVKGEPDLFLSFVSATVSRPVALILLLLAFALVIGPVNLFYFAKPPYRHRLLWTTPLIAAVAALLLLVSILLIDGTGGRGRRYALGVLEPKTKRLALWQEQISRSGLLLGGSFKFDSSALIVPIAGVAPVSGGPVFSSSSERKGVYQQTAEGWSGDWFTSRSVRAQAIFSTESARGGVVVSNSAANVPSRVTSSLETPLREVIIVTAKGMFRAENLAPGVACPLVSIPEKEATKIWEKALGGAGEKMRGEARHLWGKPGRFYAVSAKPESQLRDTLAAIRWESDTVVLTGPFESN